MPQKKIMQGQGSLAANATNDNVVSGELLQNIPFDSLIDFALTSDTDNAIKATLYVGTNVIATGLIAGKTSAAPTVLDTLLDEIEGYANQRITLALTNLTAAAAAYYYKFTFHSAVRG